MNVIVNEKSITLTTLVNLEQLLQDLGHTHFRGVAVAVNNEVIPKTDWKEFLIKENDSITIIKATQGG